MAKKKKKKIAYEIWKGIRKDWNGVNPVTKIIPDKTKYKRKEKHKKDYEEE